MTATDGTASSTMTLTINVGDVDEPPVLTPLSASWNVDEDVTAATVVETAAVTDPEGQTLTYTLTTSPSPAPFSVDTGKAASIDKKLVWPRP